MYEEVPIGRRGLGEHRLHVGDEVIAQLRTLAAPLQGARLLNLSLTPFGTVVSDLLHSVVPLLRDLGLDADWQVVHASGQFGSFSTLIYEALCGRHVDWTSGHAEDWLRFSRATAKPFDSHYDFVLLHDPQLVGIPAALPNLEARASHWVWHCHLDLRNARPEIWESVLPSLKAFDLCVFSDRYFGPPCMEGVPALVIPPCIDPTTARNIELPELTIRQLLGQHGIDLDRPLLVQAGPLDSAFNPFGAIDVYRQTKASRGDIQLALVDTMAGDSMEACSRFERVARHAGNDPDIHILVSQRDDAQLLVNAAQQAATVVLQRSVPAGFALPVWEAQWKGRPVVVGAAGGLPSQIVDGATGYLAGHNSGFVQAILDLVDNRERGDRLGRAGHQLVRERHLLTRFVADVLRLLRALRAAPSMRPETLRPPASAAPPVPAPPVEAGSPGRSR